MARGARFLNPTGTGNRGDTPVRLDIDRFPRQREFIYDVSPICAAITGIGGAKTTSGAAKVVLACEAAPGTRALVTAPTFSQLEQATIRKILELIPPARRATVNKNEHLITLINGSEIIYQSADNPDHFRGPEYALFWMDEASYCSEEAFLVGAGRARQPLFRQIILTSTPAGKNWLYRLLEPAILHGGRSPDGMISMHTWTTFENPFLPPEAVAMQRRLYEGTQFYEQDLLGMFKSFTGLVYQPPLSALVDVSPDGPWRQVVGGVDFGSTNPYAHATAAVVVAEDTAGRYHAIAEFHRHHASIDELAVWMMEAQQQYNVTRWEADRSQFTGIQLLAAGGLPVTQTPPPSVASVLDGIAIIQRRFATGGLFINRVRCPALITELSHYQWQETSPGTRALPRQEPIKLHDDGLDALRYAVVALERRAVAGKHLARRIHAPGARGRARAYGDATAHTLIWQRHASPHPWSLAASRATPMASPLPPPPASPSRPAASRSYRPVSSPSLSRLTRLPRLHQQRR